MHEHVVVPAAFHCSSQQRFGNLIQKFPSPAATMEDDRGLYCGTAGAFFQDKETLVEHYKSEFHR